MAGCSTPAWVGFLPNHGKRHGPHHKISSSPLALRESFHVVLLKALAENAWIARLLFVGDLIDLILAEPPETVT